MLQKYILSGLHFNQISSQFSSKKTLLFLFFHVERAATCSERCDVHASIHALSYHLQWVQENLKRREWVDVVTISHFTFANSNQIKVEEFLRCSLENFLSRCLCVVLEAHDGVEIREKWATQNFTKNRRRKEWWVSNKSLSLWLIILHYIRLVCRLIWRVWAECESLITSSSSDALPQSQQRRTHNNI